MILSIDCGIKNLAMCLIDPTTKRIHNWDVSGVPPKHDAGLFPCLVRHLNEKPWILQASTVLIEKQPDKNKSMKSVENLIHTYFLAKDITKDVVLYDARHKIPDMAGPGREMYVQRKKASIQRAREFLTSNQLNRDWISYFETHKKKDDLADTVMQALSYIDRIPSSADVKKKNRKLTPRKPTENQTRTKYSKANLAWIVKSGAKQDARFKKDLARYYHSVDELISEFKL